MADENVIPVAILIFGAFVIAAEVYVLTHPLADKSPLMLDSRGIRILGITIILIVVSALVASTAPVDRIVIGIVAGLLGTLAGYIIGSKAG
jgi:hypothetical protein